MCRQWAGQHLRRVAQLEVAGLVSALGKLGEFHETRPAAIDKSGK